MIDDVSADAGDPHLGALLHSVDKLREEAALRVLEIPQVNFDQQVYVAGVYYLR